MTMTPIEVTKAVQKFKRGLTVADIARDLGLGVGGADAIRAMLKAKGFISTKPAFAEVTLKLPSWAVERLRSAAQHRGLDDAETIATMILVGRLARGHIDTDVRGLSPMPHSLAIESVVRKSVKHL